MVIKKTTRIDSQFRTIITHTGTVERNSDMRFLPGNLSPFRVCPAGFIRKQIWIQNIFEHIVWFKIVDTQIICDN
jgi:hypothetical protein